MGSSGGNNGTHLAIQAERAQQYRWANIHHAPTVNAPGGVYFNKECTWYGTAGRRTGIFGHDRTRDAKEAERSWVVNNDYGQQFDGFNDMS